MPIKIKANYPTKRGKKYKKEGPKSVQMKNPLKRVDH
jgi:hypothetical protein